MSDPLVDFFDARPEAYDRQLGRERRALRAAAALAGPLTGARVVDLATGTGALAAALLARPDPPAHLTAVDAAPRMLDRAGARLGPPAALLLADVRAVPLPDGAADVVTAGYLLHLLDPPARAAVLAEARRLLRPGGVLVVVVHGSPPGPVGSLHRAAWRLAARLRPHAVVGGGPLPGVAGEVARAGLAVEAVRTVPGVYWSTVVRAREPATRR